MARTYFRCPHCGVSIGDRGGMSDSLYDIGPGVIKCENCNKLIKTGSKEYSNMSKIEKFKIFAKTYIWHGLIIAPLISWVGPSIFLGFFSIIQLQKYKLLLLKEEFEQ